MRATERGRGNLVRETAKVLLCGASSDRMAEMTRFLAAFEYEAIPSRSAERALVAARESRVQIAIWLETEATARRGVILDAAKALSDITPGVESIVIGPADDPEYAAAAFGAGVYNCMSWPVDYANLGRDLEFLRLEAQRRRELWLWSGTEREVSLEGIIGASPRMQELYEQLRQLASHNDPVLITGPVGSGKELVAVALHALMEKAAPSQPYHPLMIYRCCGLTDEKAEELFSPAGVLGALSAGSNAKHEAGENAESGQPLNTVELLGFTTPGAILIDEISDLPARAQQQLASWLLVNKAVFKHHPVRIMASSRCDLDLLAGQGQFHPGLRRLLKNQTIAVPALCERVDDIPMLVESFLHRSLKDQPGVGQLTLAPELSREAQRALLGHDWPGNVRELKNAVARAAMLAKNQRIDVSDLGLAAPAQPPVQVLDWNDDWSDAAGLNRPVWLN